MVNIWINTSKGRIKSYFATGHAKDKHVCGAITCLQRTFVLIMRKQTGVSVTYEAPKPGEFSFKIEYLQKTFLKDTRIQGMEDFFLRALWDIKKEFPKQLNIKSLVIV